MKESEEQVLHRWLGASQSQSALQSARGEGEEEAFPVGVETAFAIPKHCGSFDIRIGRDGTWFYRGSPIGRKSLCRLFSKVLHRDTLGRYWLITPAERGLIEVDCAPFFIVDGDFCDGVWSFTSTLGHHIELGERHGLEIGVDERGFPLPFLHVRDRLYGLLSRPLFYRLIEASVRDESGDWLLSSGGYRAILGKF